MEYPSDSSSGFYMADPFHESASNRNAIQQMRERASVSSGSYASQWSKPPDDVAECLKAIARFPAAEDPRPQCPYWMRGPAMNPVASAIT